MLSRFASDCAKNLLPYVPGEQPHQQNNIIKLNTNESPFAPSPSVFTALKNYDLGQLRFYPKPDADDLREALGISNKLNASQIFVGNGSDEVLAHIFCGFFLGKKITFPNVTYNFYKTFSQLYNCEWTEFQLNNNFCFPSVDALKINDGIIFANPNAPTGIALTIDYIEALIKKNRNTLIVVDEAYIDFGGETATPLIEQYDNLIVTRTFSKSHALAGLRIGYAMAHKELIQILNRVKNSFNSYPIGALAQAAAIASISDTTYLQKNIASIKASRKLLIQNLDEIGFNTISSDSNFIFTKHNNMNAAFIYEELKKRNILVRHFSGGLVEKYLRITIGTQAECEALHLALKDFVR